MIKNPSIVIIDYGVGNTFSVSNAIKALGYKKVKVSNNEKYIREADALILPGVGAFHEAIKNLKKNNLHLVLGEEVMTNKKPILGICVGMQLFSEGSEENGWHEGLNWISGKVKKIKPPANFSIPHVGWNDIKFNKSDSIFSLIKDQPNFYFDHSYHFESTPEFIIATCEYGIEVTAAVQKGNIFGIQFHPEKSQINGFKLFRSFFNSI